VEIATEYMAQLYNEVSCHWLLKSGADFVGILKQLLSELLNKYIKHLKNM
jgi:hypothetical protein